MGSRERRRAAGREMGVWKRKPQWVGRRGMTPPDMEVRRRKEARTHEWRACRRRTNRHWNLVSPTICWWSVGLWGMVVDLQPVNVQGQMQAESSYLDASYLINCIPFQMTVTICWAGEPSMWNDVYITSQQCSEVEVELDCLASRLCKRRARGSHPRALPLYQAR